MNPFYAGLLLALGSALCWSTLDAIRKLLSQRMSSGLAAAAMMLGIALLTACSLPWTWPTTLPGVDFWWALGLASAINLVANVLFFQAVKVSPLSLTIPYLSLTPALMVPMGYLFLGELPGWQGALGMALVVAGALLINPGVREGRWRPLQALRQEKGSLYMLLVALMWSITSPLEKVATREGDLAFYILLSSLLIGLPLLLYQGWRHRDEVRGAAPHIPLVLLSAVVMLGGVVLQLLAFQQINVAYVDTIKRSGALFAVLFGYMFFDERPIKPRLLGASVMVLGLALLSLSR